MNREAARALWSVAEELESHAAPIARRHEVTAGRAAGIATRAV